nr:TonB-dependent receptor [Sphingomonas sp. CDS-1]
MSMTTLRSFSACSAVAIMVGGCSSAAIAQTGIATQMGSTADDAATDDIIVTAQKRSERLQDVPISISAFGNKQLQTQGITSSSDLTQVTPGLNVTENSSFVVPFIRGVGSTAIVPGEVGSVSTYIDGVYVPVNVGAIYELANVQSIQILKGPQGTLFGRNTAGGAILITTQPPGFDWTGKLSASYGNFNDRSAHGYVNGPLSDTVAVSVLGDYTAHDGYLHDIIGNRRAGQRENYSGRAALLFKPTDRLTFTLGADYFFFDDASGILAQPRNGYLGQTTATPNPTGPYDIALSTAGVAKGKQYGGSIRAEYDFGGLKLVSITAKRFNRYRNNYDSDGTPINRQIIKDNEMVKTFSQEFQLVSSDSGPFNWVLGGFYSDQNAGYDPVFVNTARIDSRVNTRVAAIFANGTYKLGDFELTGGIRYNIDKDVYTGKLNGATLVDHARKKWTSVTPRAVIAYHPDSSFLAYASFSKGFKSGLFNQTSFSSTPINPERITAYEVGLKLQMDRSFTLNGAAFLYDTTGLQVQTQNPVTNLQVLVNAASARSKGFELDTTIRPLSNFTVNAGVSYLDAEYRSFPSAQAFIPNAPAIPPAIPNSTGNQSISIDAGGNRAVRSPKWTFNLSAAYTIEMANGGSIIPSVNLFRTSSYFFDVINRLRQNSYEIVNAQIQWRLPGNRISLSLYGKNLTDATYLRSFSSTAFTDRAVVGTPRTYGVRIGYEF